MASIIHHDLCSTAPMAPTGTAERPTVASQSAHIAASSDAVKSRLKDILNRVEGQGCRMDTCPATQSHPDNCINFTLMQGYDNLQECHALLCAIEAALGG